MRFHHLHEWLTTDIAKELMGADVATENLNLLAASQKFYAGNADLVPIFDLVDAPRLPFQKIAVEFNAVNAELTQPIGPGNAVPVIMLAEEGPGDYWVVASFQRSTELGIWIPCGAACGQRGSNGLIKQATVPGVFDKFLSGKLPAQIMEEWHCAVKSQCHLLFRFLSVLNCKNVKTESVAPPAALNKKRVTKGKPAIYEYKVLVLKSGARLATGHGSHASPRIHLRRGHLKQRKSGTFWWQPHVVGDRRRGIVMKDYDASRLTEEATES